MGRFGGSGGSAGVCESPIRKEPRRLFLNWNFLQRTLFLYIEHFYILTNLPSPFEIPTIALSEGIY